MTYVARVSILITACFALVAARTGHAAYIELTPSSTTFNPPIPANSFVDLTATLVVSGADVSGAGYSYGGVQLAIVFDSAKLSLSNITLGSSIIAINNSGAGTAFSNSFNLENAAGRLRLQQSDSNGLGVAITNPGTYSLMSFRANLQPAFQDGTALIDLAQNITVTGQPTFTTFVADQLGLPQTLDPAPLNGQDPRDSVIQTPEPSALVSLSLGIVAATLVYRRWHRSGSKC